MKQTEGDIQAAYFFQLFYLVTDLYKEGNGKEMRKWAYEIHSSFLGPGAVSVT